MKLETVRIKRFRSIEEVSLEGIGDLNVLIGKNNSGKSNLLLSIDTFFACIKEGSLVSAEPPIGNDIDYFGKRTREPIEIELSFSIQPTERDKLIRQIVSESPQMKNAAEGITPTSQITASVRVITLPRRAAFVSSLSLRDPVRPSEKGTKLLSVSNEAAIELVEKTIGSSRATRQAASLEEFAEQIDPDDWGRIKEGVREGGASLFRGMMMRRARAVDRETSEKLDAVVRQSDSITDFKRAVSSLVTTTRLEAEKVLRESLKNKIGTFAGEETAIPKYIQNLVRRIAATKVLYLKERRSPIGEEEAKLLLSLKVKRGGTAILKNIQDTVSALLGVRIDAFDSASPGKEAEMDVDDFLAEVNGSGVREALRLVLDFEFQKPALFLVEEPEIYLHPALETSMMRYLKTISSSAQVFITTHSTNFLDTAEMKNVYLVSKPKSTQVQKLNFEEAEIQIPHELGIRLSSLFLFDRLVFVEGPSDEAVLREWAAKLRINFSQVGVGFVHMGGVHNFGYFAAEQTISFLMKRRVKLWFLIDRDEKEEGEIAKLAQKCGPDASLKVLRKRELENYLIVPRVVAEFIALKRKLADPAATAGVPSEGDVEKQIEEVAEKLKALAIEKRVVRSVCKPVYPATKRLFDDGVAVGLPRIAEEIAKSIAELEVSKAAVQGAYAEHTKVVEDNWNQDKLSLVPGDLLLDGVCQAFGVRFRKEVDSSRAAVLLQESEIEDEIQQILQEIGSPA